MTDNIFGMTEVGKKRYDLAVAYKLDEFYQVQSGNIIIPEDEFKEPITRYVMIFLKDNFLKDNPKWVLGHEEGYWFLTTLADIKEA